jgi:hypothetical protein
MIIKKIIAFVLLLSVLASSFSGMLLVADYYANTGAYAKNCINKLKPLLHCNGKCQLMKKIEEQEKKDQQNADSKMFFKSIILSSKTFYAVSPHPVQTLLLPTFTLNTMGTELDCVSDIFHPPGNC